jgi:dipeptidyl aminopeptidase/acylaminoacyl peptidase
MRRTVSALALSLVVPLWLAAEANVPLPANLKAEGIPAIPSSLMEQLSRYNESRSAWLLDWHPIKREILISTRFGDVSQVHQVAMPGGARTQLTFFPDRVLGASYQPKTGESFVFMKDVGGGEFYQIFRQDANTGNIALLTDGKSRNTAPLWSNDGRSLVYASTRRNGRDTDLYLLDPSDPKATRMLLEVNGGGWFPMDWSDNNKLLVVTEYRSITDTSSYIVDTATGEKDLLTPREEKAAYFGGWFTKDGKGLYLVTDRGSEFLRLAYMDLASRELTYLRPDLKWDVADVALSKDGRRLAYAVNEGGSSTLHVMDTQSKKDISLSRLPYGVISGIQWHNNSRDLGFTLSSAKGTGDVYSIDVAKGALERWTMSETGGLNPENFSEPELIHWKSFDGRTMSGFLYMPPKRFSGQRPIIINIHGGPESQFRPSFLGRNNYFLNELGVALIFPNVRGSSGYGKSFLMLDNGMKREDSVKDIGALLDWIGSRPDLDPKRVMVTGGSYGGYMTLASMTHYNDRLRCAVDVVGISNFVTFLNNTEAYRRDLRRAEYGDERDPKMREFLTKIAPLTNAGRITKPMFIIQGKNDPRVPVTESEQMAAAIRKNGVPVWYLLAEDEGHGFAKKSNQDIQFAATVLFVKQYLLGEGE